ncbi:adenine phosphoribosyltransferase [Desulfoplanes formicivorans]|uniref:Adenine phosphoribosyltransferase n=1 Tax=Desulfoplanes formicivorans TaxID=1592317 RepID=A0A194AGL8_9BACT|nr:adenine phosphoribosyltransferase [Desulfoplanes formicivorans]GAU08226.1 adenine phosphoribosyltransferase [Desulfoplanes formicivorans]
MIDILGSLESGEKYSLRMDGLPYAIELPYVYIDKEEGRFKMVSLNLVGQTRLNRDIGRLLARKITSVFPDLTGIGVLTVVEKALQLSQVVSQELDLDAMAVAYNRIKPHMEAARRPVIQVAVDNIATSAKSGFLYMYERDMNLLAQATRGVIIIDDVVSSGSTIAALSSLVEEAAQLAGLATPPDILGVFCVAKEGENNPFFTTRIHSLARLPQPERVNG